jgi:protein-S-isoprenylcysteine O-methyltransferase Ste14
MMLIRLAPVAVFIGTILFVSVGRLDVPAFWLYVVGVWLFFGVTYTLLLQRSPELVSERMKPPSDRDRTTQRIVLPLLAIHLVLAGLDARFGWTHVALSLQAAGFVLVFLGLFFAAWTLFANPFASSAVRIQADRSQTVITSGPYAIVRHPMYLGTFLFALGNSLALDSLVAGVVMLPTIAVFVRRTLIEDRMLHAELAGYGAYAAKVRYRLIPCVF